MQSLSNLYYRIEWEENKEVGKANAIRVISSVFKMLTVIFLIIAAFSFMDIAMLIGFSIGTVASLIAVIVLDYIAGTLLYSYVYELSDKVLELKKEYRNGKITTYMKADCENISVNSASEKTENVENAENFFSRTIDNNNINYCFIKSNGDKSLKIAVDDYMLAILRRICK